MSYLFLIIPPLIIIISLAVLLNLVHKRAGDVLNLKNKDVDSDKDNEKKINFSNIRFILLNFLEKLLAIFKKYFLELIQVLEQWHKKLKTRQLQNKHKIKFKNFSEKLENQDEEDVENKWEPEKKKNRFDINKFKSKKNLYSIERKKSNDDVKEKNKMNQSEEKAFQEKDRENEPMLRKEVVYPEPKEEKVEDSVEEGLISRIASNPRDIKAYEKLGDYYIEKNNFRDAIGCYKQIIKINPANRKAKIGIRRLEKMINKR